MSRKQQEIKSVLHTPVQMDVERQKQMREFWIEKVIALIERFNLNEHEQQELLEELNAKLER